MIQKSLQNADYRPVAIGGVGGSGTRMVALILKALGYYIGGDRNKAEDNLWFTLLFKRREILSASDAEFDRLLQIFLKGMSGSGEYPEREKKLICSLNKKSRGLLSKSWLRQRASTLLSQKTGTDLYEPWGWKEPNTHVVLSQLSSHLPHMKYIHVSRNGLDMAYSQNQVQLDFWGDIYLGRPVQVTPFFSLKYWCEVHKRVLEAGRAMENNFLFLNFDAFCMNPEKGMQQLLDFLGAGQTEHTVDLMKLIQPPESIGRYREYGLGMFDPADVSYVESLGFDVSVPMTKPAVAERIPVKGFSSGF